MSVVTQILSGMDAGDPRAGEQLLPLVYDELRQLAAQMLRRENAVQTLQATALVHEAYLRLVDVENEPDWNSRGHFFAAAAEAMRRILVEHARRRRSQKRGGDRRRIEFAESLVDRGHREEDILLLDDALTALAHEDAAAAELAKLRIFAGLSVEDAGKAVGISRATAFRQWTYARAWLQAALSES